MKSATQQKTERELNQKLAEATNKRYWLEAELGALKLKLGTRDAMIEEMRSEIAFLRKKIASVPVIGTIGNEENSSLREDD